MIFDDDEEFSGSDSDDGFQEDMEALKKACLLVGKDADELQLSSSTGGGHVAGADNVTPSISDAADDDDDDDDDIQLVRSIQERFALSTELREPLSLKPLCSFHPPGSEGDEGDDFETLRAIQRRFAAYDDDSGNGRKESPLDKFEQMEPYRFLKDAVMTLLGLRFSLRGVILVLKPQLCQLILLVSQNQHRHLLMP